MTQEGGITFFGDTNFRGKKVRFGIKTDDRRRHIYIIGKTGSGKTTMLETFALADIQSGQGVAIIDPHGEFAEKMLDFVPKERINDVVYFNPADLDWPFAFNIIEHVAPEFRHFVVSGLMGVFKKIWPDVWSARMEYIMNNSILALLEFPNSTLLGINRMLGDASFRKIVIDNLADPIVKAFWETEFARYHDRFQVEAIAPIQNKVGQFISNPLIRNIIGQERSKVNIREIMDSRKIFIVNLAKGMIGEDNSALLGSMIITKLQLAAMSRVDIAEAQRKDFYLHVDEFQNFATDSFANILSEARKYHLNLTLAHQYIEQLSEVVCPAVFGNVGTLNCFRVGASDAEFLEKEFMPEFTETDLVNLPKWSFYTKLMVDGVTTHAFSASTIPPPPLPTKSYKEEIIRQSREKYCTPRPEVEKAINTWSAQTYGPEGAAPSQKSSTFTSNTAAPAKQLWDAICSNCGRPTRVPFQPDPNRPVYCENCLKLKAKQATPALVATRVTTTLPEQAFTPLPENHDRKSLVTEFTAPQPTYTPPPQAPAPPPPLKPKSEPIVHTPQSAPISLSDLKPVPEKQHVAPTVPKMPGSASIHEPKKEIDLGGLRQALDEALGATENKNNQSDQEK